MIQISVIKNDREFPLKLADNVRPTIEEFEAIFDFDNAIKGGYSMNVKIPVEGNEVVLNHAHSAFTRDNIYFFDVIIYEADVASYRAMLTIDKANVYFNNKFFDCDLMFQSFSTSIKDKLLKDCLDKEIILCNSLEDFSQDINDFFIDMSWPQAPVQFPEVRVINDNDEVIVANQWNHVNQTFKEVVSDTPDFSNPTIPQPYYPEVLRELFRNFGYVVTGELFQDKFFTRQLMPSYAPAYYARRINTIVLETTEDIVVNGRTPIVWGSIPWNTSLYNAVAPTAEIMDDSYESFVNKVGVLSLKLRIKTITPGGKVRIYRFNPTAAGSGVIDFWAVDGDVIDYTFYTNFNVLHQLDLAGVDDNYAPGELTTPNFPVTDDVTFVLEKGSTLTYMINTTFNFNFPEYRMYLRQSMNLNEMVPPTLTANEFLVAVKTMFQLKIDIDEVSKTVHISRAVDLKDRPREKLKRVLDGFEKEPISSKKFKLKWNNQIEVIDEIENLQFLGSVPNFEDISLPYFVEGFNYVVYISSQNAFYIRKENIWEFLSIANDVFEYGQGQEEVQIDIPVKLIEMYFDLSGNEFGVLPTLIRSKTGLYLGDDFENWELMIMNYLGIKPNVAGRLKPFATSAAVLFDGTPIIDGHLLLTTQEASIFNRYQKALLDILKDEEVYTFRTIGKYSSLRNALQRKIIFHEGNEYLEKARVGTIGTEESVNKIEMIRI